jgi:hypothetical protein
MKRWRFGSRWLLMLAATLIVFGNVCEFSTESHSAEPAPAHETDQGGEPHHHSAAHLSACEGAATAPSNTPAVGPDAVAFLPSLELWVGPLQNRVVAVGTRPVSLSGPPLFILHAALLI